MKFHDFDIWYHSKAGIASIILIPMSKMRFLRHSEAKRRGKSQGIYYLGVGVGGGVGVGVLPFEVNNISN
jgi:hypothetical protein